MKVMKNSAVSVPVLAYCERVNTVKVERERETMVTEVSEVIVPPTVVLVNGTVISLFSNTNRVNVVFVVIRAVTLVVDVLTVMERAVLVI